MPTTFMSVERDGKYDPLAGDAVPHNLDPLDHRAMRALDPAGIHEATIAPSH